MESCGEKWRTFVCANICSYFFLNFSFSVQGEKMFLFFFLLGAMHFSSPPHHIKILPKSPKSLQQKNQQNLTKYNSPLPPYPTSLLPPYITKKYKNKNQKKLPQHKIYPPKTSHQNSKQNKNPKSITSLNLYKIQNSTPKTSHPKIPKPYTTPKNYHHIPTLQN